MKAIFTAFAVASALALTACGGDGDDALADQAEENMENKADALDEMAANATTDSQETMLEDKAEQMREAGDAREEAIDNSDVDTDAMTDQQKNAMTNSQ